jgi:O-antigen ligase
LGSITKNGAGRFALIVIIIAMVRILTGHKKKRFLWVVIAAPAGYLLMQTQSRTALLGLAVVTILIVMIRKMRWQLLLIGPVSAYILWTSGYKWRAQQELARIFELTGREMTWQDAIVMIKQSPMLGWGFHADRILLDAQHIHNSYIHALIHSGILGTLCFVGAILLFWYMVIRNNVFSRINDAAESEKPFLIESILILGALTSRSFFESTAAFYGVDLLLFLPALAYVTYWMSMEAQGDH